MAEDFRAKITAELDTAEAENKLNAFLNKKNKLKIDVEVNQDSAKKLSSSIEKGIRQTKLDTSSITEQLAGSFNISDKNVLNKMKKQMDTMVSSLGKTWNGSDFDFKNASGFYSGLNNLSDTVTKNAKIVQGKTGIYDDFFNYFKDKKIYVSDELKKAMGGDAYKELLQNNIGKIVRDSTKGVSIDSIWGEMTSLFPEHFSTDMMNQVDQITHAFDLMKQARADMTQSFSVSDLKGADFTAMTDSIAEQVLATGTQLKDALQTNLMSATEAAKTMIDLDVEVNTEKIASDIRSAVQSAGTEAGEALNVDLKINDEQLISELRSAVGQLGTGEEPVKVNLQVDRESLQSDLNLTLNDLELPVHFKVDAEEIESQLRAAVESITDIQIDLRVNTDPVTDATAQAANTGNIQAEVPVTAPQTDTSGLTQLQQALGSVNTAGQRSQSIFSSLGSSFREAFSAYSLANLMQDGLYKITDAGKEALSTVKEFNDLETDLAMATGESRSYASDLTQSYNALGQELGSITSDVAKSADSWLRQGRSMSETNQLIKDSMVLSKDAQMDSENASEVLTATLNGFQMNADQAGHINDVLTSIDLESASDAGGIGQALTKVASQANNAGVSLEKTAAMIATIKDVTQDSDDSIGTGLKSILSRMNQIKAGKFVDSETGESLNDVEKVLNKVGISMRDVNGQFKESEPIIDEVAGKWSTFDGNTKKAVATAMAGTYQYNKLIAMFDNWDKVQSLTETALNADGTAQKKFEDNYLTSLEAKTNALKVSLENLATSTVSSDLYSGFLDGSKSLVDFANNINLVQSAIAGLGAAGGVYAIQQIVAAFRELSNLGNALNLSRAVNIPDDSFQRLLTLTQGLSESQTRLVLSSTALTDAQRAAILTNQGMSSAEAQASVAAMGLSTAEGAAAASTFSLSGALSGLWATLMANPLILVAAGVTAAVSAFSAYQHSVEEAVSSAKQAGTEWQENNTSLQDNIERITELRTALSSGTLTEQEAASAKSELLSIQEDQINALVDAAVECGLISDTSSGEVAKLVNMLTQLGVISSSAGASVDTTTEAVSDLADQIINAQEALSGIEKATSVLASQSTGKSISLDDFNSDELSDYTSALEYNNGALHLNAEKVRELQKAKAEEAIQTNENQKLEKQAQYMQNIAEIERLRDELRNLSDAKSQNAQTIQSSIDALLSENDGLVNQCNQLDLLSASLREATGAYQNWLDKQNTSESGDMFDDAMGALDHIEDVTQNTDSEDYGRIGTNSYKAAVDFIVPDSVDTEDAEAVSSYIDSIEHYFNHDSDGNRTGLDVAEFCAKATKAGLMELDEASGEYKIAGQRTMQDFADGLNLSLPMVQAMFGEMEEFGGEFDWADEAIKTLGDLGMAAGEAKGRIEELSGDKDLDIQIDVSDIDSTEDKVKTLDNTIQQMQDYKGTLEVDSSQVDDANTVIQYCVTQKQMLEAPAVMDVDTSQVDGELGNTLSLLQQFQQAQNNVELQAAVGADTSEAQGQVDSLVSEIDGLTPEIKATLGIDTTSETTITASIQALTPKMMVEAGVDSSVVDAYAAEEKKSQGTVEWDNNTGKVDAWAAQMHTSNGQVNWTNNVSQVKTSFTATGTVNWTNTSAPTKGAGGASGSAHVSGSAHYPHLVGHADAKGNWGTKTGGMTLVGELGREIVVDPATGTWHTVGDNGAEFQYIPAGSIVFNHLQTESLLEQGFVNSRGMAKASGTAMVRGGISVSQVNIASGHKTYSGSSPSTANTAAVNNNTKAAQSLGKTTSDAADKVDEALENAVKKLNDNAMDWVETAMDRLDRTTSKYTDYAESDNSHYTKSQKYYEKAIASTQEEIDASKAAMKKYWDYAQKVAADATVSQYLTPALKKKIDEGKTIDIESLSASQKAAVDAYKEWIDKYLDAKDTNREKRAQKLKLAKAKVDNVYDSYDLIIGKRKAAEDYYSAKAENRIANGKSQKIGSVYYKDMKKQRDYAQYQKDWTSKEMKAVQKRMKEYLKTNGNNRKDKAYQEMLKQYTELKTTYVEADTHIQELTQAIQDARENVKQWAVDRWERAGSKQDAAISYKEVTDNPDRQISEKDYTERIKTDNRQILALQKLRAEKAEYYDAHFSSWNNEEAQEYLDSIAKIDEQILNLGSSIEELKNKIMELRWKPFDDLQDKIDSVLTEYQTMQKLLGDEDSFYNDDGSLTENGLTNVLLLQESIDLTKDKLANYRVALDKLEEQYKNGCYSAEEYKEKTEELLKGIQNASSSLAEYRQQMISVYETQVKTENDLLQDNIDKRLEALDAKEKYYDYDKNIKKKSKDINALKSSIAALEGTTNAAARARLEKLKAELADAEEDMQDTVHEHEVEMKKTGYENLQEDAENALDNTLDALKKNTSFQEAVINNMLNNVKSNYDSTYKHLGDVMMDQYGMKVSQTFDQMITKAADFNTAAVNATKAWEGVYKMDTSKIPGASNGQGGNNGSADKVLDDTLKKSDNSDDAGNVTPGKVNGTTYSLKLNATEIYLTYSHLKYSLKATWSPSKPEHSDIEWSSTDKSVAKVSTSGVVTGVAAPLSKLGLMSRDESLTRKCKIIANGGPGLAKAECTVHIMPDEHYGAIKRYADRVGIDTSKEGNNLREAMEYAYKNGAFRSNQSSTAVEGFQKAYLKDWFNALPNRPDGATDVPSGVSQLAGYFYSKGKQVTRNDMQKLADILQIKTPGVGSYDTWGAPLKNKILKAYKAYGFSKGGVVRNGIPANILDMIGGDALIPRGDSVLIGANPGETVLTKEFTDQLKPTVATLNAFNEMMAKPILSPGAAVQNQNTEIVAENHFIFNNPVIKSEEDAEKLMEKAIQKHMEKNKRDWKKVR